MKLNDLFTRPAITARPDEALEAVARLMWEHNIGAVVVVEDERPVGIVTDRDLAMALGVQGLRPSAPVREVMTRHVVAVPEDAEVLTATRFIKECEVRRLPIVDREDRVVGVVSLDDLMRVLSEELSNLAAGVKHEVSVH